MRRVVLVICDGHRADFLRADACPYVLELAASGRRFANHGAIYPSATRASAASVATGCAPARHGLHGNTMALDEGAGPVVHDAGRPEFRAAMRKTLGRTLKVPTLAERLRDRGGVVVFSNVSPGAAFFHDPDHHGHVYHRAGSCGPGGAPLAAAEQLRVSHDAAGDRAMTERFCAEVLLGRKPALAVLWLCEPDQTMHHTVLGSSEHLDAVAHADACVRTVADAVARMRADGDDVLLMVGSDHGHETVADAVPVEHLLIAAGLKEGPDSTDVALAPQGAAGHLYLAERARGREAAIVSFLRDHAWLGEAFVGEELRRVGLAPEGGLRVSFSMRKHALPNANGVPGVTDVLTSQAKPAKPQGFGSHGGLGAYERGPFLLASGGGFVPGGVETAATSLLNIAPTALAHLGAPRDGVEGLPLPKS